MSTPRSSRPSLAHVLSVDTIAAMELALSDASVPLWNPLSITTLIVAVLGFLGAAFSIWQTYKRDHPKVHWEATWKRDDSENPAVLFRVENRGRGVAQDVTMYVKADKEKDQPERRQEKRDEVAFSESMQVWFDLSTDDVVVKDVAGVLEFPTGTVTTKAVRVRMTWSQLPDIHKLKSESWVYRPDRSGKPVGRFSWPRL